MKNIFFGFVLSLVSVTARAEISYSMPSLEAGFKWSAMDGKNSDSNKQSLGYQFGGSLVFNFNEDFGLKTGLMYSERPFKFAVAGQSDITGKITYADILVHFMFKVEDYAGIYIGPSISTKIGDEVSIGKLTGVKSMVIPITFGGQFKFNEMMGLNLFFETVAGDLSEDITGSRGIGTNLMINF